MIQKKTGFLLIIFFFSLNFSVAQKISNESIRSRIQKYQDDPRGPYLEIRWFCDDGSIIPPRDTCPDGGAQRASYKPEVVDLAKTNHIFLGQILSKTVESAFLDASNNFSRLKQYQLERYLQRIDDGWVNRKGQFYRGAYQIEDEIEWGEDFFKYVLRQDELISENYFLIRQAAKDIPHHQDTDESQRIRSLSKIIAEAYPKFMDLRVKIHGQPDASDLPAVQAFQKEHAGKFKKLVGQQMEDLIADMKSFYAPLDMEELRTYLKKISTKEEIRKDLISYMEAFQGTEDIPTQATLTAAALLNIRTSLLEVSSRTARLALIDLSNNLENIYFKLAANWQPTTIKNITKKIYAAGEAATGSGFLELWEWNAIAPILRAGPDSDDTADQKEYLASARRIVEWGAGMTRAVYDEVVELYRPFEPKAYGFIDDRVRASPLLDLGTTVGKLGEMIASKEDSGNYLLGTENPSNARGLNSGIAMGELVVLESTTEDMVVDKNKIYVFNRPPSDLKPVAGIATVTEGNLVSHVQLLARNLSIPNAVISDENFANLRKYNGKQVFYAITSDGKIILKEADKMTDTQKALFSKKERNQKKVSVPIERIDLTQTKVLNMRNVDATDSGVLCGPKAANLGQLKKMYPGQVVEGLVIPFGIFRQHMDLPMVGQEGSYWDFLKASFAEAEKKRVNGTEDAAIESFLLKKLETLQAGINDINFQTVFVKDLNEQFKKVFDKKIGEVPVFLRSDTNMEDLKNFTGAGLNLTLFNIVDADAIMNGIKKVWASPYSERSFKWRQRYLLNPENVFPSILIIPSVDVDFSGVLITKGITSDRAEDLTLAISRGAGGAVDGQAAESYLLRADGTNQLLTPAREPGYRRLPVSGGTSSNLATFEKPIISKNNLDKIRSFARTVENTFPDATDGEVVAAYDIEFGFSKDKLWLFQIRPFVESKNDWETQTAANTSEDTEPEKTGDDLSWWWILGGMVLFLGIITVFVGLKSRSDQQRSIKQDEQEN